MDDFDEQAGQFKEAPGAVTAARARQEKLRAANRRTALLVGALALFFFALLFVKRLWIH